jgi:uncharacterized damage-inducible protein DinB
MFTNIIQEILVRDLGKLRAEIEAYQDEKNLWIVSGQVSNSAGNLCLHLMGNLNNYIGKELGGTSYVRNRPLEFSQKDIARNELLQMIDQTILVVKTSLEQLDPAALEQDYPDPVFGYTVSTGHMLVHLSAHLAYHLGQINYHRRLLDKTN